MAGLVVRSLQILQSSQILAGYWRSRIGAERGAVVYNITKYDVDICSTSIPIYDIELFRIDKVAILHDIPCNCTKSDKCQCRDLLQARDL